MTRCAGRARCSARCRGGLRELQLGPDAHGPGGRAVHAPAAAGYGAVLRALRAMIQAAVPGTLHRDWQKQAETFLTRSASGSAC